MTKLFLLRHGETKANLELRYQGIGDSSLSEIGIEESRSLAKSLKDVNFSAIYSSTLERSFETASIVADNHALEVIKLPGMIERDYGIFEGLSFKEIKEKHTEIYQSWLKHPDKTVIPKAETLEDLQKRGVEVVEALVKKHKDQTICVVGHGGINRTILFHYMNLSLDNFWRIKQDNCCINIIEFDHIPIVTLLNSTFFVGEKRFVGYY
jgi:broad specificity phosphatase PhoE